MPDSRQIGKYEILEELGRGGFAVVYKARDTTLDRPIALKILHPQLTTDPKFVGRFCHEAQVAAKLHHPNIVTIYEVGEEEGQQYLAMAYLPGRTLDEMLSEGPLPTQQALSIVEQIASALDVIHERGLVHRDVKPANVMVSDDGHATLLDFGIVRAAEGTRLTTSMVVLGTPEYMAPEQAEGEEPDARSDVYALGVLAYGLLTGQVPFSAPTPLAVLRLQADKPPPSPRQLNPSLTIEVERVLLTVLAKNREERYQSAGDFAAALRQALSPPGKARPLAMGKSIPSRTARIAAWWLLGLSFLFLPALGLGVLGIISAVAMLRGESWGRKAGTVCSAIFEAVGLLLVLATWIWMADMAYAEPEMPIVELLSIVGLAGMLSGIVLTYVLGREPSEPTAEESTRRPAGIWPIAFAAIPTVVGIVPAVGLLRRKNWGRLSTIVLLCALACFLTVITFGAGVTIATRPSFWVAMLIQIVEALILSTECAVGVFYLMSPHVRTWFRNSSMETAQ